VSEDHVFVQLNISGSWIKIGRCTFNIDILNYKISSSFLSDIYNSLEEKIKRDREKKCVVQGMSYACDFDHACTYSQTFLWPKDVQPNHMRRWLCYLIKS
jgi:hypothetical protein